LSSYAALHDLTVASEFSVKDQPYSAVYNITLNPFCVTQRASKKFKKFGRHS
jgi:hypothetical protein